MLVEGVLLRDVTDVTLERVEILVERLAVQEDLALGRLELSAEHAHERALARAARAHHADELAAVDRETDPFERDVAVAEAMVDVDHLEAANDVALFLDDSFGEIAAQKLADIDPDGIAVGQRSGRADGHFADHDRAIGFQHFQNPDALVVVAEDFQEDIARGAGRKQDVVLLEQARIIRDEIFGLRSLELKTSTHGTGAAAEIEQIELGVVRENDPVFERGFDFGAGLQVDVVQLGPDVAERFHLHLEAEGHFERAVAAARAFHFDLVGVAIHPHENLRERDVFLGVEIGREVLEGEHLVANEDALPGIDPAKPAARERPAAHRNLLGAVVLQKDEIVITKGEEPVVSAQAFQGHIGLAVGAEGNRLERRGAALINGGIGFLGSVQLINDVDRLRGHAELRHEGIKRYDLLLFESGLRDQIVELHAEHDLAIGAERGGEFLRHGGEILLLVERLPKEHAQLRVNRFRIVVAQKAKARIDLLLEKNAIGFGETRQYLDEQRQQVRPLRDAARFTHRPAHPTPAPPPQPPGQRGDPLDGAIDSISER